MPVNFIVRDYTKNHHEILGNHGRPSWHFKALSHTGDGEESNSEHVSEALYRGHTVAAIVKPNSKGEIATHMWDHKRKMMSPMVDGDNDDQIEKRREQAGLVAHEDGTGSDPKTGKKQGVVTRLLEKGGSHEIKESLGDFSNDTSEERMRHPDTGEMVNVVEINRHLANKP